MVPVFSTHPMSKFLRIEKSLTSAENVVLTIVNRRPGATLLNCDEEHRIEVSLADLRSCIGFAAPLGLTMVYADDLSDLEDKAGDEIARRDDEHDLAPTSLQGL